MIGQAEVRFVQGLFWKTLIVGVVIAAVSAFVVSTHFAGSLLVGVLVSSLNMRVLALASRKMVEYAANGHAGSTFWAIVLGIKLLVMMVLTYVFVIVFSANVFGFVIGYSVFLIAIFWQALIYVSKIQDDFEVDGSIEETEVEIFDTNPVDGPTDADFQ